MENGSMEVLFKDTFSKNASESRPMVVGQDDYALRMTFIVAMIVFSVAGFFGNFLVCSILQTRQ
jgi:hypothetical protein